MQFLDLHTHIAALQPEVLRIQSLHLSEATFLAMPKQKPISIGLHPWYTKFADFPTLQKYLKVIAQQANVRMIGECGLDKLRGEDLSLQLEMLRFQVQLGDSLNKPIILHCVKAFDELIALKNSLQPKVPLIIHGFQKNAQLATQLLGQGFYLSVGASGLKSPSLSGFLKEYTGPVFLETDQGEVSIELIYEMYADLKKISVEKLKDIIFANWQQVGLLPY
ncbi:MAG: hydrolase TatD [Pedobacter sp.]|nr:MAG: hydrolase TatD [Pedobacter sp.]